MKHEGWMEQTVCLFDGITTVYSVHLNKLFLCVIGLHNEKRYASSQFFSRWRITNIKRRCWHLILCSAALWHPLGIGFCGRFTATSLRVLLLNHKVREKLSKSNRFWIERLEYIQKQSQKAEKGQTRDLCVVPFHLQTIHHAVGFHGLVHEVKRRNGFKVSIFKSNSISFFNEIKKRFWMHNLTYLFHSWNKRYRMNAENGCLAKAWGH